MKSLRTICEQWNNQKFVDQLEELLDKSNGQLVEITKQSLNRLGILDKKVNGYASEGLQKSDEGVTGIGISYSETFHNVYDDSFNPTKFLFALVSEFVNKKCDIKKLDGFLARGLRTLTSLLREPDFAEKLLIELRPIDKNIKATLSPKQDSGDHTDVLLNFKGQEYRIWLFQFSDRGLPHDIDRLTERRGVLPFGLHILCPLKSELAIKHGVLVDRIKRKENILISTQRKLDLTSPRAKVARAIRINRLEIITDQITQINKEIEKEIPLMTEEIEVVSGWYFYSDNYLKRVAKEILKNNTMNEYTKVKEMLEMPRKYLEEIQIFKK